MTCTCDVTDAYRALDRGCPIHGTVADARRSGAALFRCAALEGTRAVQALVTESESEAVAWATLEAVSPRWSQVTIEAEGPHTDTFAIRHFHPGTDSGWRCWRDGEFVGALSLDRLFADRAVAS